MFLPQTGKDTEPITGNSLHRQPGMSRLAFLNIFKKKS
jgi:hypothetical protein